MNQKEVRQTPEKRKETNYGLMGMRQTPKKQKDHGFRPNGEETETIINNKVDTTRITIE